MALSTSERVQAVRRFNRFYTHQIGVLQGQVLDSGYSLTEARILYELHAGESSTAAHLSESLGLNPGYLSRIVARFETRGLLRRTRSTTDARAVHLELTEAGESCFRSLDTASQVNVERILEPLSEAAQQGLLEAMESIRSILARDKPSYRLRDPRPGDMGWIVHKQAELYAKEYGWNGEYEALTAEIVAKFIREFDSNSERCWIAELDGRIVGSVFLVRNDATTAKLRLLYVDAAARGMGIGGELVQECIRFARQVGYERMALWTSSVLHDAVRLYEKAGFTLEAEESSHSFGKDLTFQVFSRDLKQP